MSEKNRSNMHTDSVPTPIASPSPLIDKEALMEKLELIPIETLRNILTNQVDLEIRLKHKELKLSEEEIGKCEAQMLALRQFFEVPNELSFRNEPNDFTLKYYDILNRSLSINFTKLQQKQFGHANTAVAQSFLETEPAEPAHSYRTRSTTSSLRPSIGGLSLRVAGCIYRRTDGIIVRLTCPDCQRSNFSSAQGFLNHNRIAHNKEFASQDDAALKCGEVLPDAYQDEEGLASLAALKEKCLNGANNLNINNLFFDGFSKSSSGTPKSSSGVGNETHQRRKSTSGRGSHLRANSFLGGNGDLKSGDIPYGLNDGTEALMSKLIRDGVTGNEEEYKLLVNEFRSTVANSHLFDDEEEIEEGDAPQSKVHTPIASRPPLRQNTVTLFPILPKAGGFNVDVNENGIASNNAELPGATGHKETKPKVSSPHPEKGGKYENRLRRRRPRSDTSESARVEDGNKRRKRRV